MTGRLPVPWDDAVKVFEVAIHPDGPDGRFRVDVLSSPDGGEARAIAELDVTSLLAQRAAIEDAVLSSTLSQGTPSLSRESRLQAVGRALFGALLGRGEIAGRYRAATAVAGMDGETLRVVLRITDPALAALPWEAMYDDAAGGYVCRRDQLVRHVGVLSGLPPLAVDPPLRVLGIVSSPTDLVSLDVAKEQDQLAGVLDRVADGRAELTWAPAATWSGLQEILLRETWHVVHFIGHGGFDPGRGEGVLALADERGRAVMIEAGRLVSLLGEARPMPRLVVLNSCSGATSSTVNLFSSTAATLVRGGVRAVTAMQYAISDVAAVAFACGFYRALTRGRGIDEAVSSGRVAIIGLGGQTLEWVTPVLYQSGRGSRLFTLEPAAAAAAVPAGGSARPVPAGPGRPILAIPAHEGGALRVAFGSRALAGRGPLLASAGADGAVRLWDLAGPPGAHGRLAAGSYAEPAGPAVSLAFHPHGTVIAAGWTDGPVRVLAVPRGPGEPPPELARDRWLAGHAGTVTAMAFAADGELLITAGEDELLLLHYLAERKPYHLPGWRSGMAQAVAVSPDGEWLAVAGADQAVRIWSVSTWEQALALTGHTGPVSGLAFSPDGGLLASAAADGTVRVWDAASGRAEHVLAEGFDQAWSVAFHPGRVLLAAATDDHVTLWHPGTGARTGQLLQGRPVPVLDVAFSQDGALLAAAGQDGRVPVWEPAAS